jgi:hypothetical protein
VRPRPASERECIQRLREYISQRGLRPGHEQVQEAQRRCAAGDLLRSRLLSGVGHRGEYNPRTADARQGRVRFLRDYCEQIKRSAGERSIRAPLLVLVSSWKPVQDQYEWSDQPSFAVSRVTLRMRTPGGAEPHTKELAACLKYALLVWMSTRRR